MTLRSCYCVGGSKCNDESCRIVQEYIARFGYEIYRNGLNRKDNDSFNRRMEVPNGE